MNEKHVMPEMAAMEKQVDNFMGKADDFIGSAKESQLSKMAHKLTDCAESYFDAYTTEKSPTIIIARKQILCAATREMRMLLNGDKDVA